MKIFMIVMLILIALMDFALFVMCSHMENREQYKHMRGRNNGRPYKER